MVKQAQPDLVEVNDLSARIARTSAADLITGLSATKKKTIRSLVARGIEQGWSDAVLQARIKQAAGLSPRDVTALENYRSGLLKGGTPPGRTARMVDQYAGRLRRARAALIARTETRQVLMDAQRGVWKRMQETGDLSPYAVRVTRLHKDERLCAHCRSKNGQRHSLKDSKGGPPFHPRCRCWEEIEDQGIAKHLPGLHDQKDHGRRGLRLFRAEGPLGAPGYAGRTDERTGRYFGGLDKALKYVTGERHLYEVRLTTDESLTVLGNPDDHVLLSRAQADRKKHSDLCPNHIVPNEVLDIFNEKARAEAEEIIGRAVNNFMKSEPRDGDQDGWVYDGTPQMRPATPRKLHNLPHFYNEAGNTWIQQYGGRVNLSPGDEDEPKTLEVSGPAIHYRGLDQEEIDNEYAPTLREIAESADVYGFRLVALPPSDERFRVLFKELGFIDQDVQFTREPKDVPQTARYDTNEVPLFDKREAGAVLSGARLRELLEAYRDHPIGQYEFGYDIPADHAKDSEQEHFVGHLKGGATARYVVRVKFPYQGQTYDLVVKDVGGENYAYNEDWAGSVASALGLPFDAVKMEGSRVVMPHIDGEIGYARHVPYDDPTLKGSLEMAVLDVLIQNEDRNGGNYLMNDENQLFPIDHAYVSLSGLDDDGAYLVRYASQYSPFVTQVLINRQPNMGKLRYLQGKIDAMTDDDMPVDVRETMRKRMRALIKFLEGYEND